MYTQINNQSIRQLIRKRYSCRSFQKAPIPPEQRELLSNFLTTLQEGPLGNHSRFMLIAANETDMQALKGLTTYGFIKHPTGFIMGATSVANFSATSQKGRTLEDFGYLMETAVLYATSLDLGTVWLGGTFNKGRFAEKMHITEGEQLPAVIATGVIAEKPRPIDSVIRRQARGHTRKTWSDLFFKETFDIPLSRDEAGTYTDILDMVQLAPSASNKQPWRIVWDGNKWHFFMQRSFGYADRNTILAGVTDMQRIDMGIAMCHFALTSEELNLTGYWEVQEPPIKKTNNLMEYTVSWVAKD
jgi:nitroreductase